MPELPEVEVTRLGLAERLSGSTIVSARMGKPLRWPLGIAPEALAGRRILALRRRGKYLLADLEPGLLLIHLGMSGSLSLAAAAAAGPPGPHDHFDLVTTAGLLRLHDPRRFGAVVYATGESDPVAHKLLSGLGAEPLTDGFEAVAFHQGLKARRSPIKQVLLAGDLVVGVGNIYASEALFLAGIRPTLSAQRLSLPRTRRLHEAIRDVLARAVATGGSTLRDFSNADGQAGYFQLQANVYGRTGEPCRTCGVPIRMLRQGQRATFFCPKCQQK